MNLKSSTSLVAGSFSTLHFEIIIGEYGFDDGGHIKLAWPVSNAFGVPQFDNPEEDNYSAVKTTGNGKLKFEFDHNAYIRPYMPCITIKVFDGDLERGDIVSIVLGDKSEGSRGWKTQTYIENNVEFRVLLDPFGTNLYERLPDSPHVDIVPDKPASLTVINPSKTSKDQPFWVLVRADDKWGNPARDYSGEFILSDNEGVKLGRYQVESNGVVRLENVVIATTGVYSLFVKDESNGFFARGNPIEVSEKPSDLHLYWGDLHGQTGETVGSGTIEEYLEFGMEVAGIDFISHAANAFQVTQEIWEKTQAAIKQFHKPKRFVTFLGYEWSGVTSAGGDHNVYYLHDDMPIHRCSHALVDDKSDLDTDRYPVSELYREFAGRDDVLIIPHIGGRRATLDVFDEDLTPFIEIVSVHGHFEWFAKEALEMQLKTGFIASSDTHSGRPGDTFPVSYIEAVSSGLTGVYATDLTRKGLWEAFRKRHVYGTTGPRIVLEFLCNESVMGDEVSIDSQPQFSGKVIGTTPLEKVEIYRGAEVVFSQPLLEDKMIKPNFFMIRWKGARTQFRRKNVDWSGSLQIIHGDILSIQQVAFDLPWEGITNQTNNTVEFVSTTAGDYDGFIVEYGGDEETRVEFSSEIATTIFDPNKITQPVAIEVGEVELGIEILPIYEQELPSMVEFEFMDQEYDGQKAAYYLRIQQVDGEKAWSSPIFVNWR